MDAAENAIDIEISKITDRQIEEKELTKVKNRVESHIVFADTELLHRTMNLAYYELLGDASLVNEEVNNYLRVSPEELLLKSREIFVTENCSTLYYHSKN